MTYCSVSLGSACISPFQPSLIPNTSYWIPVSRCTRSSRAVFTTHFIAGLIPAQSPPPVRMPILLFFIDSHPLSSDSDVKDQRYVCGQRGLSWFRHHEFQPGSRLTLLG